MSSALTASAPGAEHISEAGLSTPPRSARAHVPVSPGVLELSSTVLRTPVRGSSPFQGRSDQLLAELSPFGRAVIEATVAHTAMRQSASAPSTPARIITKK